MILVTGISAVGKTYTISEFTGSNPAYRRVTASEVLHGAGRPTRGIDREVALANQLLLPGLLDPIDRAASGRLILDGHAAVETSEGALPVPTEVIERLPISGIVLVTDQLEALTSRRRLKGRSTDLALMAQLQSMEQELSSRWAQIFGLRYREVRSGDHVAFSAAILDQASSRSAPL
jgi:adenylate kinase